MDEKDKQTLEENINNFKKIRGKKLQFKPIIDTYSESYEKIRRQIVKPMQKTMEKAQKFWKKMQPILEVLKKVKENDEKARKIRGEIITSIIILEDLMEEIILELFVKENKKEDFSKIILTDENFSSGFKKKILDKSGLLKKEKNLSKKIQILLEIRNSVAHSKYRPNAQTVEILYKKKITDIFDLEKVFQEIFKEVIEKLNKISKEIKKRDQFSE